MKITINETMIEAMVMGGAILGGGGGGWIEEGKKLAEEAIKIGFREILSLELIDPSSLLLTVSAVGAPSAGANHLLPENYARAVEIFLENSQAKIIGLISSEIGAMAIVNGWVQSALLGIPVVDAPANGRAHPLGLMGSMGLHKIEPYISQQAAVGRDKKGRTIEKFFIGPIEETARAVRKMAAKLGSPVAVARNPVEAGYVKLKGASGAIRQALSLGNILIKEKGLSTEKKMEIIICYFQAGDFLFGRVEKFNLQQQGDFDIGKMIIKTDDLHGELFFWNEYITWDINGQRVATFPDLIMTFEAETGLPLISAAIKEGMEIFILSIPASKLILGAGVKDLLLLKKIEKVTGQEIIKYCHFLKE